MFFYQVFINIKPLYFTIRNNPYFTSYQLKGRPGVVRGKKIENVNSIKKLPLAKTSFFLNYSILVKFYKRI